MVKLADSQCRAGRMEATSSCQELFIKKASSGTKLKSNGLAIQYSSRTSPPPSKNVFSSQPTNCACWFFQRFFNSFTASTHAEHTSHFSWCLGVAALLLFLNLKQSSGDFSQPLKEKKTNSKNLTVVSPLPVEVLWLPAVCRQVQRMWTSDHGYGECLLLPSRCVYFSLCVLCVCGSEPGDL